MMQKISRICIGSTYNEDTVKTKVKTFIMDHVGKSKEPLQFGSLLETITMNVEDLGECTENTIVDFTKGVKLLENTWLMLLKHSSTGHTQETNIMKIGLAGTNTENKGFLKKSMINLKISLKIAKCSSLGLKKIKEMLKSNNPDRQSMKAKIPSNKVVPAGGRRVKKSV
jgi:hypothetical protein